MHTFIYVDSTILDSYVSQMYGGLVTRKHQEASKATKETGANYSGSPETSSGLQVKTPIITVNNSTKNASPAFFNARAKDDREIEFIEKVFHDNAVQDLIDRLSESKELVRNPEEFQIGDYVLFSDKYDVFDIDFLREIFNKNAFSSIMKLSISENIGANREERRSKKGGKKSNNIESILDMFNATCLLIPCKKMIVTKEHLIPLDDQFLRESLQNIRLRYGRELTILGKITNTPHIASEERGIINPEISALLSAANLSLFRFISTSTKWITTPIALFFE